MPTFWISIIVLLSLALFVLWQPLFLWKKKKRNAITREQTNVDLYHHRLAQLELQAKKNIINKHEFEQQHQELQLNLLTEHTSTESSSKKELSFKSKLILNAGLSLFVISGSLMLYQHLGHADRYTAQGKLIEPEPTDNVQQVITYVETIKEKISKNPEDYDAWLELADVYMNLRLYEQAAQVYDKVISSSQPTAQVYGQQVTALYFLHKNQLEHDKVQQAIQQALKLDPLEPATLLLIAMHAYFNKNYEEAIATWNKLIESSRTDIDRNAITMAIAQAKKDQGDNSKTAIASTAKIKLTLTIDPSIHNNVQATDTLFVVARKKGTRIPVAVMRQPMSQFPIEIELTDEHAMNPNIKLSSATNVDVTAIVSHSGQVPAKTNDLKGTINDVSVNHKDTFNVVINKIVP